MTGRTLMILALIVSAGCSEEKGTQNTYTPATEQLATAAPDTPAVPAQVVSPPPDTAPNPAPPLRTSITLDAQTRPPVRGTATLTGLPVSTQIDVVIDAGPQGGSYAGVIRLGPCDGLGAQITELNSVTVDSAGAGRAISTVSLRIDSLLARPHSIVYGRGARVDACGTVR